MAKLTEEMKKELIRQAWQGAEKSYSPYSNFKVGAAVLASTGEIYRGCNIENVSYGITNCAERTAIFKMVSEGCTSFTAICVAAGDTALMSSPCGACRQVMAEFCADMDTPVVLAGKDGSVYDTTVGALLPDAFLRTNLIHE
ncbi:MAG: cytidine deaminase [Oscillospiraceae bacterium]|nr:cytidine deaminase [Oscillospiraceae bacterium]